MNILHHKSWHVYNKTNIEKVRQDEEKARQEEKEKQDRAIAAEKEYRLQQLRLRAKGQPSETVPSTSSIHDESSKSSSETITSIVTSSGHINFFADAEKAEKQHIISTTATNPEYEAEKKAKEKKYEKQFTKYLDEFDKAPTPWYLNYDTKVADAKRARDDKEKTFEDPLSLMNSYLSQKNSYDDTVRPDHHLALPAPPPAYRASHDGPVVASRNLNQSTEQKFKRSRRVEGGDDTRRTKKDSRREKIKKRQRKRRTKSSDEDISNSSSTSSSDDSESSSSSSSHYTSDSDTDTRSHRSHRQRKNRSSSHHKSKKLKSHKSSKLSTSSKPDLSSSSSTSKSISQLRAERLRRESEERSRLSFVNPSSSIQPVSFASSNSSDRRDMNERTSKYNNQFNPHVARQNVSGSNRRGGMGRGEKYVDRYR
ncbi:hypothetical protein BKA69DRAFT_1123082 [Paraphysoderma sedebokerense]|nr:hypothetical protein BKA69DRAFT_1123082 [Paraphysoderma sedebokerense]